MEKCLVLGMSCLCDPLVCLFPVGEWAVVADRCAAYYELLVYPFGSAESRCHAPAQQKEAGSAVSDNL